MGANISNQQLERWKHERIDRLQGEQLVREINTEEDIEAAIKALLAIMTLREKLGQLQQLNYSD
jgi:GTP:adenosylcobinamide-phosphate guanylyltransferase